MMRFGGGHFMDALRSDILYWYRRAHRGATNSERNLLCDYRVSWGNYLGSNYIIWNKEKVENKERKPYKVWIKEKLVKESEERRLKEEERGSQGRSIQGRRSQCSGPSLSGKL